jgi:hypothetical protein
MEKIVINRALLEQALEALEGTHMDGESQVIAKAITALRAALERGELREQDARAEQIMSEIWAQPDQTYEYIGAKLAENMQKAIKNRALVSIEAVRSALEQEEQEPVAWLKTMYSGTRPMLEVDHLRKDTSTPVFTHPPRREWQSDELLAALRLIAATDPVDAALDPQRAVRVARAAIEAALKEKNT